MELNKLNLLRTQYKEIQKKLKILFKYYLIICVNNGV